MINLQSAGSLAFMKIQMSAKIFNPFLNGFFYRSYFINDAELASRGWAPQDLFQLGSFFHSVF